MKTTNIVKQIKDIQDCLSVFEPREINNYLMSLSFNQEFISLCESFENLDSLLQESINESYSNCSTVYCTLQSMIDYLS